MPSKNKNKYSSDSQKRVTIVFGYSLFALTIVMLIVATVIPWVSLFFSPQVLRVNVAVILIALIAGALLPMLISFIIGGRATHEKSKLVRHYNGVLFGVAAYWMSLFFSLVSIPGIGPLAGLNSDFPYVLGVMLNAWPIVATLVVMAFVAFTYAHHQDHKISVLQHRPYQIVLAIGFAGTIAYGIANIFVIAPIVMVIIAYRLLVKVQPQKLPRVAHAVVSVSMGMIAVSIVAQLISVASYSLYVSSSIGILVWVLYLRLVRQAK